jgi:hypothetical protein
VAVWRAQGVQGGLGPCCVTALLRCAVLRCAALCCAVLNQWERELRQFGALKAFKVGWAHLCIYIACGAVLRCAALNQWELRQFGEPVPCCCAVLRCAVL